MEGLKKKIQTQQMSSQNQSSYQILNEIGQCSKQEDKAKGD